MLKAFTLNTECTISSSIIKLYRYISETYENEFVSAAGDSGLVFSGQMIVIEIASIIMSDFVLTMSPSCILLHILRHNLDVKCVHLGNDERIV